MRGLFRICGLVTRKRYQGSIIECSVNMYVGHVLDKERGQKKKMKIDLSNVELE